MAALRTIPLTLTSIVPRVTITRVVPVVALIWRHQHARTVFARVGHAVISECVEEGTDNGWIPRGGAPGTGSWFDRIWRVDAPGDDASRGSAGSTSPPSARRRRDIADKK